MKSENVFDGEFHNGSSFFATKMEKKKKLPKKEGTKEKGLEEEGYRGFLFWKFCDFFSVTHKIVS